MNTQAQDIVQQIRHLAESGNGLQLLQYAMLHMPDMTIGDLASVIRGGKELEGPQYAAIGGRDDRD